MPFLNDGGEIRLLNEQDELLMERIRIYWENIEYQKGFYKGFNFNKIHKDLESIYILYDADDTPLYVGESNKTQSRLKAHLDKYNTFDKALITKIKVIPFTSTTTKVERCIVERMFINLLNPLLNELNRNGNIGEPERIELKRLRNPHSIGYTDKDELEKY